MNLGMFSISLAVADLEASLAFYKAFGFETVDGDKEQGWLILKNGDAKIGLFRGMFEDNLITFNPPDARAIQAAMVAAGHGVEKSAEEGEGPTHFVIKDPDGNMILVDQH